MPPYPAIYHSAWAASGNELRKSQVAARQVLARTDLLQPNQEIITSSFRQNERYDSLEIMTTPLRAH